MPTATLTDSSPPSTALGILEQTLYDYGYEGQREPEEGEPGPQTLYVAMGQLEGLMLVMKFVSIGNATPEEDPPAGILHGTLVLPITIPAACHDSVSHALHQANRFMPIGAFCLGFQQDGSAACYYQTSVVLEPASEFPVASTHAVIDMAVWAIHTFAPMISAIAQDRNFSVTDYLAKQGLEAPPVTLMKTPIPAVE